MSEDGVYVGSGSFRVDRKKALEKLKERQLTDLRMAPRLWVRAAVAGGATRVRVRQGRPWFGITFFEMRFDGRPFNAAELGEPYGALFGDADGARARNRDLAVGLLTALRAGAREFTVTSGRGRGRRRLILLSELEERVEPVVDMDLDTVIRLRWPARWLWDAPVIWDEDPGWTYALCPIPVWSGERELPRAPESGFFFEASGVRGWLDLPDRPGAAQSELGAYVRGVRVCGLQAELGPFELRGCFEDDRLRLNASLSGVAQDENLTRTLGVLRAQAKQATAALVKAHMGLSLATARDLVDPNLRAAWASLIGDQDNSGAFRFRPLATYFAGGPAMEKKLDRLRRHARACTVLRDAAARLLGDPDEDARRGLGPLWDAAIFFDARGEPLSLRALRDLSVESGGLRYSSDFGFGNPPAVWCPCASDPDWLRARFPGQVSPA